MNLETTYVLRREGQADEQIRPTYRSATALLQLAFEEGAWVLEFPGMGALAYANAYGPDGQHARGASAQQYFFKWWGGA